MIPEKLLLWAVSVNYKNVNKMPYFSYRHKLILWQEGVQSFVLLLCLSKKKRNCPPGKNIYTQANTLRSCDSGPSFTTKKNRSCSHVINLVCYISNSHTHGSFKMLLAGCKSKSLRITSGNILVYFFSTQ